MFSDTATDSEPAVELEITTVVVDLDAPPSDQENPTYPLVIDEQGIKMGPGQYIQMDDENDTETDLCDLVAAIEQNTRTLEECVQAINQLGTIVQFMSDGTANMFGFFNSIGADLESMTLGDKMKLITGMMKGSRNG